MVLLESISTSDKRMANVSDSPGASTSQRTMSKLLRQRAHDFLISRKHANNLMDIIDLWDVSKNYVNIFPLLIFEVRNDHRL